MDKHRKAAAILAVIIGTIGICGTLLYFLSIFVFFIGLISEAKLGGGEVLGFILLFVGVAALALGQFFAGYRYLSGVAWARTWLIGANLLLLIAFPIGTVIGAYSLWAILRKIPRDQISK